MQVDLASALTLHKMPAAAQELNVAVLSNVTACARNVTTTCISTKVMQLLLPESVRSKIDNPVQACFTLDAVAQLPACNDTDAAIKSAEAIAQALRAQMLELNITFGQAGWPVRPRFVGLPFTDCAAAYDHLHWSCRQLAADTCCPRL